MTSNIDVLYCKPWHRFSVLGPEFLVRYSVTGHGYCIFITDCVHGWTEERDCEYISAKKDEWASCVDASFEEFSNLILEELVSSRKCIDNNSESTKESIVHYEWIDSDARDGDESAQCNPSSLILTLQSALSQLPFQWKFSLAPVAKKQVQSQLLLPLSVLLHTQQLQLQTLQKKLTQMEQKLDDLTPDGDKRQRANHNADEIRVDCLHRAVDDLLTKAEGTHSVCVWRDLLSEDVYTAIRQYQMGESTYKPTHNSGAISPSKFRKKMSMVSRANLDRVKVGLLSEEQELERRATFKVMGTAQASVSQNEPKKKKKKLNI